MPDTAEGRRPRKSPWPAAAAAAGLVVVLLAAYWCVSCPDTLTLFEWKYRYRVHEGMTLAEVESVLGPGKPGGPRDGPDEIQPGEAFGLVDRQSYYWEWGGMEIWVAFRDGRVVSKSFRP
jgi:hypothetical protein